MTTTQLQLRRDTTANVGAVTPAQGEPIYDVTRKALVLGDGATAGGNCVTPFSGTWTPQLQFGGANVGMTGAFTGTWFQIGTLVFAFFNVVLTAKGSSSGAATVAGLPTLSAGTINYPALILYHANLATSPAFENLVAGAGASVIQLGKSGGTVWTALAGTDFTNTSVIEGCAIYQAAQPTG